MSLISGFFSLVRRATALSLLILLGLILAFNGIGTIEAGQRWVVLRFGAVTGNILGEGLYFKVPFADSVRVMDVRVQKEESTAASASKDLQNVSSTVAVNFHIEDTQVAKIFQDVGPEYKTRLIDPAIQEAIKATTAGFTAEELVTKREIVRKGITDLLIERLGNRGIIIDGVNIVNFEFSAQFNAAIDAKVSAEQNAQAAKNKLEQIKYEAQQRIEEARGKAEAIRVESEALTSAPDILQLRAIEKWNGVLPQVTSGGTPLINIK